MPPPNSIASDETEEVIRHHHPWQMGSIEPEGHLFVHFHASTLCLTLPRDILSTWCWFMRTDLRATSVNVKWNEIETHRADGERTKLFRNWFLCFPFYFPRTVSLMSLHLARDVAQTSHAPSCPHSLVIWSPRFGNSCFKDKIIVTSKTLFIIWFRRFGNSCIQR